MNKIRNRRSMKEIKENQEGESTRGVGGDHEALNGKLIYKKG